MKGIISFQFLPAAAAAAFIRILPEIFLIFVFTIPVFGNSLFIFFLLGYSRDFNAWKLLQLSLNFATTPQHRMFFLFYFIFSDETLLISSIEKIVWERLNKLSLYEGVQEHGRGSRYSGQKDTLTRALLWTWRLRITFTRPGGTRQERNTLEKVPFT